MYLLAFIGQGLSILSVVFYLISLLTSKNILKHASLLLWLCYGLITYGFITDDITLRIVLENTNPTTPLIYKIVGIWGCSSGSMLLWVCLLSTVGFFLKKNPIGKKFFALHMIGFIILQFLTNFPFETVIPTNFQGDLNPLLQDQSMVLHPPILYIGNIIFAYLFFVSIDRKAHPLALPLGFAILTLGIALGSFWAYYELGWGGFWYWDPVEVISLIPWLLYVLGFHLAPKGISTQNLYLLSWPIVLLCFALVRSGLLISVHSFSQNTHFLIHFFIFWSTTLLPVLYKKTIFSFQFFSYRNVLLFIIWFGIVSILIFSLIFPLFKEGIYFGSSFFQASVWPLILPVLALMGLYNAKRISFAAIMSLCVLWFSLTYLPFLGSLTLALTTYGLLSLKKQPLFMVLGHGGWHILISACVLVSYLGIEEHFIFKEGMTSTYLQDNQKLSLKEIHATKKNNYIGHQVTLELNNHIYTPEIRFFPITETTHTQMSIHSNFYSQSAIVIENMTDKIIKGCFYYRPFIHGIWLGVLFMIIGILLWVKKKSLKTL